MNDNNRIRMHECECRVLSLEKISESSFIHEFEAPEIAQAAEPGHFLQVRISRSYAPFLPRPFSILDKDIEKGTIRILYKVFGDTTAVLSTKKAGQSVVLLGPLGNTFSIKEYEELFLVAGGIGIPPLYNLLKNSDIDGKRIKLFFGAATKDELYLYEEFDKMPVDLYVTTDDGSYGKKQFITVPFESELKKVQNNENTAIISCGPMQMLRVVQELALVHGIPAQLSVEAIMACGIGLCQGCALPRNDEKEYSLVCTDGPIFNEKELKL
ncbi:MAG: dihydroorotate dehydrogenase electron transfer subunit [bacterium]|nr:dihydroorotate dehydrogenase electron transfer subunit [bacterium]